MTPPYLAMPRDASFRRPRRGGALDGTSPAADVAETVLPPAEAHPAPAGHVAIAIALVTAIATSILSFGLAARAFAPAGDGSSAASSQMTAAPPLSSGPPAPGVIVLSSLDSSRPGVVRIGARSTGGPSTVDISVLLGSVSLGSAIVRLGGNRTTIATIQIVPPSQSIVAEVRVATPDDAARILATAILPIRAGPPLTVSAIRTISATDNGASLLFVGGLGRASIRAVTIRLVERGRIISSGAARTQPAAPGSAAALLGLSTFGRTVPLSPGVVPDELVLTWTDPVEGIRGELLETVPGPPRREDHPSRRAGVSGDG